MYDVIPGEKGYITYRNTELRCVNVSNVKMGQTGVKYGVMKQEVSDRYNLVVEDRLVSVTFRSLYFGTDGLSQNLAIVPCVWFKSINCLESNY